MDRGEVPILIASDSVFERMAVRSKLMEMGFTNITEAGGIETALECMRNPLSLIIAGKKLTISDITEQNLVKLLPVGKDGVDMPFIALRDSHEALEEKDGVVTTPISQLHSAIELAFRRPLELTASELAQKKQWTEVAAGHKGDTDRGRPD